MAAAEGVGPLRAGHNKSLVKSFLDRVADEFNDDELVGMVCGRDTDLAQIAIGLLKIKHPEDWEPRPQKDCATCVEGTPQCEDRELLEKLGKWGVIT
jgi:hypothetical protein